MGREEHQSRIEKVCGLAPCRRFADACEPLVYGVARLSHRTVVFVVNAQSPKQIVFLKPKKSWQGHSPPSFNQWRRLSSQSTGWNVNGFYLRRLRRIIHTETRN